MMITSKSFQQPKQKEVVTSNKQIISLIIQRYNQASAIITLKKQGKPLKFETYPFEKLNNLLKDIVPNSDLEPLSLTIGEPQFDTPQFILDELNTTASLLNKYPKTSGEEVLRDAMLT